MAQLIDWLAGSGARNADGTAVSSGLAWFYERGGGTTSATVYTDVDGTVIATQPVVLDAAGRAVVYTIEPVRALVQDATGVTVLDVDDANVNRAEAVQVDNASWTAGYLDDVLTAIGASTGGADGQYLESGGATPRSIQSKFSELSISVKDFGAKGDGLAIDTTAVQAAVNRVAFLGGGIVYFPPGTYLIDQQLSLASKNGVSFAGAGSLVSVLKNTSTLNTLLGLTSCSSFYIQDIGVTASSTSSGTAVALSGCSKVVFERCSMDSHLKAITMAGVAGDTAIASCQLTPYSDANARCVVYNLSGTSSRHVIGGGTYLSTALGTGVELDGTANQIFVSQSFFNATPFQFNVGWTGGALNVSNCALPSAFTVNSATDLGMTITPSFGYKTNIGASTFTPDRTKGDRFILRGTAVGTVTIAVPSLPPSATNIVELTFRLWNNSGGNVTWAFAAGYHLTGAFAAQGDGTTNVFKFVWDGDNSVYREVLRAVTT